MRKFHSYGQVKSKKHFCVERKELIEKCNSIGNKILTVHSRGSANEVLSIIGDKFNGKIIMHWYSGTLKNLQKAIKPGGQIMIVDFKMKRLPDK